MPSSIVEDAQWVDENYKELHEKYQGKYIVAKGGRVIVVADEFAVAHRRASEILGKETKFVVERIERGDLFAYCFEVQIKNHQ